jgi:hypothetical protein
MKVRNCCRVSLRGREIACISLLKLNKPHPPTPLQMARGVECIRDLNEE